MQAIRERIQPKFQVAGGLLAAELSAACGDELFLHIARHARRTVNPPPDTWLAIAASRRGYKQYPHFQLGLFDDRLFLWLAFIDELPRKRDIAETFLAHMDMVQSAGRGLAVSLDHTKKTAVPLGELELKAALERFRDVKACEWLIGRQLSADDARLADGDAFMALARETFTALLPLYRLAFQ